MLGDALRTLIEQTVTEEQRLLEERSRLEAERAAVVASFGEQLQAIELELHTIHQLRLVADGKQPAQGRPHAAKRKTKGKGPGYDTVGADAVEAVFQAMQAAPQDQCTAQDLAPICGRSVEVTRRALNRLRSD